MTNIMIYFCKTIYSKIVNFWFALFLCFHLLIDTVNSSEKIHDLHTQQKEKADDVLNNYIKLKLNEMLEIKNRWKNSQNKSFLIRLMYAPVFIIEFIIAYNISNPYK